MELNHTFQESFYLYNDITATNDEEEMNDNNLRDSTGEEIKKMPIVKIDIVDIRRRESINAMKHCGVISISVTSGYRNGDPPTPLTPRLAIFEKNLLMAIRQAPFHEQIHFKKKCPEYISIKHCKTDGLHAETPPVLQYIIKIHSLLGTLVADFLSRISNYHIKISFLLYKLNTSLNKYYNNIYSIGLINIFAFTNNTSNYG